MVDRVPLQYPLYGATFGDAVRRFWRKWNVYSGRASRSEFWWAYLFVSLVSMGLGLVLGVVLVVVVFAITIPTVSTISDSDGTAAAGLSGALVGVTLLFYAVIFVVQIPILVPTIAAIVRRLHDAGFSGLLALLLLVPGASIVVLVLCILESKPEGMRFDLPPQAPVQPVYGSDPDPSSTIRS